MHEACQKLKKSKETGPLGNMVLANILSKVVLEADEIALSLTDFSLEISFFMQEQTSNTARKKRATQRL